MLLLLGSCHWYCDGLDLEVLQAAHHCRGVQTDGLDLRRRCLLLMRVQLNLQWRMLLLLLLDDLQGLMLILRLLQLLMHDNPLLL